MYRIISERYGSKEAASEALRRAGIPGNKYYDQMSRPGRRTGGTYIVEGGPMRMAFDTMDEAKAHVKKYPQFKQTIKDVKKEGTRNYVIWDQDVLDRSKVLGGA